VDDGPVAAAAEPGLAGPELDAACHAVLGLPPDAAIAVPAWWDANAPARRVAYVRRSSSPLPPPPWPVRRALDFCAALALALAPLHEAGAAHGALRPEAVRVRPDGGPLVCAPFGTGSPADDLDGLGQILLLLLTARPAGVSVAVSGEAGPARETAALLEGLLATAPDVRPGSAREVAARLSAIAAAVPDTTPAAEAVAANPGRRRVRVATALVLLAVAGGAGALVLDQRVGSQGPALSPGTVSVPEAPAVTP
jgi:hypothetical protein